MRAAATSVVMSCALVDRSLGSIRSRIPGGRSPPPVEAQPLRMRSPSPETWIPLYAVCSLGCPDASGASGNATEAATVKVERSIL